MSEAAPTTTAEKPAAPAATIKAILGQKVGMTQIFDAKGQSIPVTVVQAGPCHVLQVLTKEKHGYAGIQVAYGDVREKSVNKPDAGQFKKANTPVQRWSREFRTEKTGFQVGQTLKADIFTPGDFVDVWGISKGKGFAGAMKRHNFSGGPSTHGQSDRQRAPGSSGSNTFPGRVYKGKRFPGHMGVQRTTIQHLEIVEVVPGRDLLMIRGAVPGSKEGLIVISETVKRQKHRTAPAAHEGGKKDKAAKKEAPKAAAAAKPKAGK